MVAQLRDLPAKQSSRRIDEMLRNVLAPRRPACVHLRLLEGHTASAAVRAASLVCALAFMAASAVLCSARCAALSAL